MQISNEQTARAWLATWDGKPRKGILGAAVDGLRKSLAICRQDPRRYGSEIQGYEAAIVVLTTEAR
jgi:hypothetical protein